MKRFLSFFLASTATLMAAPSGATVTAPPSPTSLTLWEMLLAAGWVMYPLLILSVIVVSLIIYYFITVQSRRVSTEEFRRQLEGLIRERNFSGLLEVARSSPQVLARVMGTTVQFVQENPEADFATVKEVAQAEGNRQASGLSQEVVYLMDAGVLAPMLGLFGTVVGILRSFGDLSSATAPAAMRTQYLAGGVAQALVATAAGLIVGIMAMFFYSYFRGRAQALISQLESASTALVAQLGLKLKK